QTILWFSSECVWTAWTANIAILGGLYSNYLLRRTPNSNRQQNPTELRLLGRTKANACPRILMTRGKAYSCVFHLLIRRRRRFEYVGLLYHPVLPSSNESAP